MTQKQQRNRFVKYASRCLALVIGLTTISLSPLSLAAMDPAPSPTIPGTLGAAHYYSITRSYPGFNGKTLDRLAADRFGLVRYIPDWQLIETKKEVYDFSYTDWIFQQFAARGIRPIIGLGLNNRLYNVKTRIQTPEQRQAFGRFVQQLVHRYRGKHVIWEIWNEPNIPSFWPAKSGESLSREQAVDEYLALVNSIVPIIRKEDPTALVIGPAAANYNTMWLYMALKKGLLSQLDGLSVHPYQPGNIPEKVIAQHNQVQSWIARADRQKPIFFTELGYSTGVGSREVSAQTQANYLQRSYLLSLMLGIKGNIFYSLIDTANSSDNCQTSDHCYGLFTSISGTPKPGLLALENLIRNLNGYVYQARIPAKSPSTFILQFNNSQGETKYAVWDSNAIEAAPVAVQLPNNKKVQATQSVQVLE